MPDPWSVAYPSEGLYDWVALALKEALPYSQHARESVLLRIDQMFWTQRAALRPKDAPPVELKADFDWVCSVLESIELPEGVKLEALVARIRAQHVSWESG